MSIFKNYNPEAKPHINCRELLRRAKQGAYNHQDYIKGLDEDGEKLIELRKQYKSLISKHQDYVSSLREGVELIDQAMMTLLENVAYSHGYHNGEDDLLGEPMRVIKNKRAERAEFEQNCI